MGQPLQLAGQKFGKLTVISPSHVDKNGTWKWDCICECGGTSTPTGSRLKSGRAKSCGCASHMSAGREAALMRRNNERSQIGRVYGMLTVISKEPHEMGDLTRWNCLCECGGTCLLPTSALPFAKSCGCMQRRKYKTKEQSAIMRVHRTYTHGATKRGYEWKLSFEEFSGIVLRPCVYCGELPKMRSKVSGGIELAMSGVDRVDNSKGYVVGNVVPCCSWCNTAKMHHSMVDFIAHCRAVAANFPEVGL